MAVNFFRGAQGAPPFGGCAPPAWRSPIGSPARRASLRAPGSATRSEKALRLVRYDPLYDPQH